MCGLVKSGLGVACGCLKRNLLLRVGFADGSGREVACWVVVVVVGAIFLLEGESEV